MPAARSTAAVAEPEHAAAPAALFRAAEAGLEAEQLAVLRQMPTKFLVCRSDRHNWKTERGWRVQIVDRRGEVIREHANWGWRAQVCRDCGATVEKYFDPQMRPLAGGKSEYPTDGKTGMAYLTKGLGRIPPHLARWVLWERDAGPQPEAPDD